MASKNLWGDLSNLETVRSPKAILQEQAQYLTNATEGVLVGAVDAHEETRAFVYELDIQVPALNDYVYTVFSVRHDIELYPVMLRSNKPARAVKCADEQEFRKVIASILGSEDVKRIVARLLSLAT